MTLSSETLTNDISVVIVWWLQYIKFLAQLGTVEDLKLSYEAIHILCIRRLRMFSLALKTCCFL